MGEGYLSRMRAAFRSIFAFSAAVRLPAFFCCDARAFAFAACGLSGIGYLCSSGRPNVLSASLSRFFSVRVAMRQVLRVDASGLPRSGSGSPGQRADQALHPHAGSAVAARSLDRLAVGVLPTMEECRQEDDGQRADDGSDHVDPDVLDPA